MERGDMCATFIRRARRKAEEKLAIAGLEWGLDMENLLRRIAVATICNGVFNHNNALFSVLLLQLVTIET